MERQKAIWQLTQLQKLGAVNPVRELTQYIEPRTRTLPQNPAARREAFSNGVKKMRLAAEEWGKEWQTLISILMSARTRDETTIIVAGKLFKRFPTLSALAQADPKEVYTIIRPVNYSRNKTKNVIACARALVIHFKGKVPHDCEKLILLPGVGRKTANVFLAEYGADTIGVDTHVAYISKKLGWTKHGNPHKIEQDLLRLFPRKYWRALNSTLVRFGKSHTNRRKKDEVLESLLPSNS